MQNVICKCAIKESNSTLSLSSYNNSYNGQLLIIGLSRIQNIYRGQKAVSVSSKLPYCQRFKYFFQYTQKYFGQISQLTTK